MEPVFAIRRVSKRFDGTQALDDVSLELYPGEVHTLLGENGAGKSTLIKIMTGIHQPDTGELLLDGKPIAIGNSAQAQLHGIAAIYQEPMVFPDLNVAENIFISHQNRGAIMRWGKLYRDADAILKRLGVSLDVRNPARGLTLAAQQTVEIAKALSLKTRVLIMDEPTASLSAHEVAQLFKLTRNLRDQGVAILFISHRLEEVFEISDRITIFRDGKRISTGLAKEYNIERAIRDMVGREMESFFHKTPSQPGDVVLSVRGLARQGVFEGINFDLRAGEVLGFAGLVGSGRTDVALALFGIAPPDAGEIHFLGKRVNITSPEMATQHGIAYVPEDRRQHGLVMPFPIVSNISLPTLRRYVNRIGLVDLDREKQTANEFRDRLTIRSESIATAAGKLSGGNQQKVVLSKWLNTRPKLLILDEPTRGIDVGAKSEVHAMINDLAQQGLAILMISSDLPEVLGMSDRILVMREGRQMGIFSRAEASQEVIMTAAMGQAASS